MIVMKFGGTSVEDAAAIRRVINIVSSSAARRPLVVLSACAGVTNDLIRCAGAVAEGRKDEALAIRAKLRDRHIAIAADLVAGTRREEAASRLEGLFVELKNYIDGVSLLGELTPRTLDAFTGFGERLSTLIVATAMAEEGVDGALIDAREVMMTDDSFGAATPLMAKTAERARAIIRPLLDHGRVVVTQGFIGATATGAGTTIGRGGSDYSAAIFGAVLQAEEIQIWTDVDGMMSADPRIVPGARLLTALSFGEASELAYFGAKVLHPKTILPAVEKNIPVRILNSRKPEVAGTMIVNSGRPAGQSSEQVKSIACKTGIVVIQINSYRMLMAHGFLAKLFSVFAEHQKSVDVVATSEVSVSLTVDSEEGLGPILRELETIAEINIRRGKAIICVVGEAMRNTPGVAARIFSALAKAEVNIDMISEGASEINLTVVVDERNVASAVRSLHDEFYPSHN
jgi:aspartate kinase